MVTFATSLLRTRLCPSDTLKPLSSNDVSCCWSASRTTFMSRCSRLCCGVTRSNRSKTVGWCLAGFPDIIEHAAEYLFPRLNEIWHVALAETWGWKHLLLVVIHIEVWIYCQSWMELTDFARLCCHSSYSWSTNIDTTFENQVLRIIMNWLYCVRRCIWCELCWVFSKANKEFLFPHLDEGVFKEGHSRCFKNNKSSTTHDGDSQFVSPAVPVSSDCRETGAVSTELLRTAELSLQL